MMLLVKSLPDLTPPQPLPETGRGLKAPPSLALKQLKSSRTKANCHTIRSILRLVVAGGGVGGVVRSSAKQKQTRNGWAPYVAPKRYYKPNLMCQLALVLSSSDD
jgi:hypothetical protein